MPPPPTPEHDTPTASSARPLPPFASLGDRLPTIMASYLFGSASTSNRQPQQPRAMASNISASTTSETGHAQAGTPYTAMPPTIVMPQEWSVPAYLKHSVFYDRFTVSPSSVPPLQSTSTLSGTSASSGGETLGSITGTLEGGRWGSLVAASSTSFIDPRATTASGNPAVRLPSQALSAQERYQECLDTPHAKIPLPSKLDPKHCCKRLLIQDGVVQFCPEKDDQGRDSELCLLYSAIVAGKLTHSERTQ